MSLTWDVGRDFQSIRESHSRHFPKSRVRLLRRLRPHLSADTTLLRGALRLSLPPLLHGVEGVLQRRSFGLGFLNFAPLAHQLVSRWQLLTLPHKSPGHLPRDSCPSSRGGWSSIQFGRAKPGPITRTGILPKRPKGVKRYEPTPFWKHSARFMSNPSLAGYRKK